MEKKLRDLIKQAMKERARNKGVVEYEVKYQTYKNILECALKLAKDEKSDVVSDTMIYKAVRKEIKQAEDVKQYVKEDESRYDELQWTICIAESLLPRTLSDDKINDFISKNKGTVSNMGEMMKLIKSNFNADELDMKHVSQLVKEIYK